MILEWITAGAQSGAISAGLSSAFYKLLESREPPGFLGLVEESIFGNSANLQKNGNPMKTDLFKAIPKHPLSSVKRRDLKNSLFGPDLVLVSTWFSLCLVLFWETSS